RLGCFSRHHFRRQRFGYSHRSAMRQAFMITPETLLGSVRSLSPRQSVSKKKAAPNNPARMVVARQRLIYYRRRRADHTDQSDQPARTTSQSFFNRRHVEGFQAERTQG